LLLSAILASGCLDPTDGDSGTVDTGDTGLDMESEASQLDIEPTATDLSRPEFRTLRFGFADDRLPDISGDPNKDALYAEIIGAYLAPQELNTLYFTRIFVPDLDPDPQTQLLEDDWIVDNINRFADYGTALNIGRADLPYLDPNVAPASFNLPSFYASRGVDIPDLLAKTRNSFPPTFAAPPATETFGHTQLRDYIGDLYDHLSPTAQRTVSFETGNEPEALQFFWGDAQDYLLKAAAIHSGLRRGSLSNDRLRRPYRGPIYFGGFTSAAMTDLPVLNIHGTDNLEDFFDTSLVYNDQSDPAYPLGFHVFRHLGYGEAGDVGGVQEKRFDAITSKAQANGLDLTDSSVSSYSLFGKVGTEGTDWKVDLLNSDFYVYDLSSEVLPFTYTEGISEFYFWKLYHRDVDNDQKGMFRIDTGATQIEDLVQPTGRFESVALVWELIADGYRVETDGDYTEITGRDPTGRTIKKLIVTANRHQSPILVQSDWNILRQSQLMGTESWIDDMDDWYGFYRDQGCSDCVVPNTDFDWVRYDIELEPDPISCTVTLIEPDHGLTAEPGGVLDIEWALSGYDDGEVYLSVFSGWDPAQYYFNAVVDNDGHHTWDVPASLNPSLDYSVYIESAADGERSQRCWAYAALDVLPFTSQSGG
jgi:hypothetical protein